MNIKCSSRRSGDYDARGESRSTPLRGKRPLWQGPIDPENAPAHLQSLELWKFSRRSIFPVRFLLISLILRELRCNAQIRSVLRLFFPLSCSYPVRFLSKSRKSRILGEIRRFSNHQGKFPVVFPCSQETPVRVEAEAWPTSQKSDLDKTPPCLSSTVLS